jgi:hypothetical protein
MNAIQSRKMFMLARTFEFDRNRKKNFLQIIRAKITHFRKFRESNSDKLEGAYPSQP